MATLREKMLREMQLRRFTSGTQGAYTRAVEGLAKYYDRSPDRIESEEVKSYLLYLMNERKLGWSTVNCASAGIRFLYTFVLGREDVSQAIPPRKTPKLLPEILSAEELERLFAETTNLKHRVFLMIAYAAGLRKSELRKLKVDDIDSSRMMIRVREGKGRKDRYSILSDRLLLELREYWKHYQPEEWLFPGEKPNTYISRSTAGEIYRMAKAKAGIKKKGGIHTLRHCFATHLLEAGADLRTIQILMGHGSIRSTIRYLQLTRKTLDNTPCLLDLLELPEPERFRPVKFKTRKLK